MKSTVLTMFWIWKKENDLVLKIGFDSSGLYDIGQEKGYGAAQNMWMKGVS